MPARPRPQRRHTGQSWLVGHGISSSRASQQGTHQRPTVPKSARNRARCRTSATLSCGRMTHVAPVRGAPPQRPLGKASSIRGFGLSKDIDGSGTHAAAVGAEPNIGGWWPHPHGGDESWQAFSMER
ncbi:Hypothetical protein A7982_10811 [Minicystis rosea]|nr:Hypothetical protein A7982_10811 [Minicystis rosea]